jgi:hypothetical protein
MTDKKVKKRKSRAWISANLADQTWGEELRAQTGKLMSANPLKNPKNPCLLIFSMVEIAHLSDFLFQFLVPVMGKPQISPFAGEAVGTLIMPVGTLPPLGCEVPDIGPLLRQASPTAR